MNELLKELIESELEAADKDSSITPELLRLDGFRITTEMQLPDEEFLFRMFGTPCFPRRDLTTVTGLEKCGKSIFTSLLMACCAKQRVLEVERISEEPLKVLWYDTEQSSQSTLRILKGRVAKLIEGDTFPEELFYVFNVRSCTFEERLEMLTAGIAAYKPDLVIIDNISDLLPSINDSDASINVIGQLMQLASEYNCNVTVVIHLNRSGEKRNLRGWLGTELLHKSFEVFYCERIYNTKVFSVEQTLSRYRDVDDTLYYEVTDEGLPKTAKKPDIQPRDEQGRFASKESSAGAYQMSSDKMESFCQQYIVRHPDNPQKPWEWDLRRLFADAMGDCAMLGRDDLKVRVMNLSHIRQSKYYDKILSMAMEQRIVQTTLDRNGRIVVIMP